MASMCVFLVLLLSAAQASQTSARNAPPPATGAIRGRVVAADSGQPLRNAQVRLTQIDASGGGTGSTRESRAVTTDADGRYEFKELPPGRYNLSASKGAYVGLAWGQERPDMPLKPIDLPAAERLDRIDFALPRGGVITGRIVDEFGEPMSGLQVGAMRPGMMNGKQQLVRVASGSTNDLGEFRIYGIPPGQYFVEAVWRRFGPGDPTSPDRTGYPVTFFPGTTVQAEAQRSSVAATRTIGGLAMAMSPIKTARVEGVVVDAEGRPMGNAYLELLAQVGGNNTMSGVNVRPDGTFVFASLAPGDYVFRTQPTATRNEVAMVKLTLDGEDIKDLRLTAMPPATIGGRLVIDPSLTPPSAAFSLVTMLEDQPMPGGMRPARVADDLTFELMANPGRNRIGTLNLPMGWTMRSVRVNGLDVIDDGIEVTPGQKITGAEVELTTKISTVSGLVTNTRGEPAKDYTLVVFPTDNKRWKPNSRYLRTARPDQDGRFKISGLPPADYNIVAIEKLEPNVPATDPDFLERILSGAKRLSLSEGETKTVDLKLTPGS
jgi:protocatechuate 3,4-dioxygenase beta subunit